MTAERLLLHHCCGPCSPKVSELLRAKYSVESFWFNPNIQPGDEHEKRLDSFKKLAVILGLTVHYGGEYSDQLWTETAKASPGRCTFCYCLRLTETAKKAKELGIPYFSTTLLVSPYQKHDLVRDLGNRIGEDIGCSFVYHDFRPAYYEGKNFAFHKGLYMQKYCGCSFSKAERGLTSK